MVNQKNDELYFMQRFKVIAVDVPYNGGTALHVEDANGIEMLIAGDEIVSKLHNATQFDSEQSVTRTELNNLLINSGGKSLRVSFNKIAKGDEVKALVVEMAKQAIAALDIKIFDKKPLKWYEGEMLVGEECIKNVFVVKVDDNGYCQAIDIDRLRAGKGDMNKGFMNINLKGTNWMILDGVKYTVKK